MSFLNQKMFQINQKAKVLKLQYNLAKKLYLFKQKKKKIYQKFILKIFKKK